MYTARGNPTFAINQSVTLKKDSDRAGVLLLTHFFGGEEATDPSISFPEI